jgi:hypothetical protein
MVNKVSVTLKHKNNSKRMVSITLIAEIPADNKVSISCNIDADGYKVLNFDNGNPYLSLEAWKGITSSGVFYALRKENLSSFRIIFTRIEGVILSADSSFPPDSDAFALAGMVATHHALSMSWDIEKEDFHDWIVDKVDIL